MARRGPMVAAKRKRETAKREKRERKLQRRAERAAARTEARETDVTAPSTEQDHE